MATQVCSRLTTIGFAAAASMFSGMPGHAAGFGAAEVRSSLGAPFQARVQLLQQGNDAYEARCLSARLESADGTFLARPSVNLKPGSILELSTAKGIYEPIVHILVQHECGATVGRKFEVLLDPADFMDPALETTAPHAAAVAASSRPAPPRAKNERPTASSPPSPPRTARAQTTLPKERPATGKAPAVYKTAVLNPIRRAAMDEVRFGRGGFQLILATSLSSESKSRLRSTPDAAAMAAQEAPAAVRELEQDAVRVAHLQESLDALRTENAELLRSLLHSRKALAEERKDWRYQTMLFAIVGITLVLALAWIVLRNRRMRSQEELDELAAFDILDTDSTDRRAAVREDERLSAVSEASLGVGVARHRDDRGFNTAFAPDWDSGSRAALSDSRCLNKPSIDDESGLDGYTATRTGSEELHAEEVSDLLELIEMWTSLDDAGKALDLLKPYLESDKPGSPIPWLGVLEVYSALRDKAGYESAAARLKTHFNVDVADWESRDAHAQNSLDDFPHVKERIIALWPSEDIVPYLNALIVDSRDGTRSGFGVAVFKDLLRLLQIAQTPSRRPGESLVLNEQASTILFNPTRTRFLKQALRPLLPKEHGRKLPAPAEAITEPNDQQQRLRIRPKYITTAYERMLLQSQSLAAGQGVAAVSRAGMATNADDGLALVEFGDCWPAERESSVPKQTREAGREALPGFRLRKVPRSRMRA